MAFNVVHLHIDKKFISNSERFFSNEFENIIIYIGKAVDDLSPADQKRVIFYNENDPDLVNKLLYYSKPADLVVCYSLLGIIPHLVLALPKKVKVAWRFLGIELYKYWRSEFLTPFTLELLKSDLSFLQLLTNNLKKINYRFFWSIKQEKIIKVIQRCDLFLGIYEEEYLFFKERIPELPEFIPLNFNVPADRLAKVPDINTGEKKYILLGISRNYWNNHYEILDIIDRNPLPNDFQPMLLFNYGKENSYTYNIADYAKSIPKVKIIENFMTINDFEEMYKKVGALVLNSKRQMGVGNIILGLLNGIKIYLNPKNTFYSFLIKNQVKVFTVQEFNHDINNNLLLSEEDINYNYRCVKRIIHDYSLYDFQHKILTYLRDQKNF